MIRVCPERDARCPHGMSCPYADGYRCKEGWQSPATPKEALETIETYFARQIGWSRETFGPALRTKGVIEHIRKELLEIEAEPHDLSEWIDVIILAMDGFWRHGGTPDDLLPHLLAKQRKNMARKWPDWRLASEDKAIEHDRFDEPAQPKPEPSDATAEQEAKGDAG